MDTDLFSSRDRDSCQAAYTLWLTTIQATPEGPQGPAKMRRNGHLGGVKRVARNRLIITFCKGLVFKDISLNTMKFAMKELFGVAVAHEDLLAWATPGRKADNRVDKEGVLAVLTAEVRARAKAQLERLNEQWQVVKAEEYAAAMRDHTAHTQAKAKALRGGKRHDPFLFEDISLNK